MQALNFASEETKKRKKKARHGSIGSERLKQGPMQEVLREAQVKFNLPDKLHKCTVESRLQPTRRLVCAGKGTVSPMAAYDACWGSEYSI